METVTELGDIAFDMPKTQSSIIKVIGVGGGGGNAVNYMFKQGIKGVDYVICNTDAQALEKSPIVNKIQLGISLTEGLGAGADPEIGEKSAMESVVEIQAMLGSNTKMVFITAGMGGGTGTGAAPIIAKVCKEMGILTIGIVTSPFKFEGQPRFEQAQKGIEKLRQYVDSLIVVNNNKLRDIYGNLSLKTCYVKVDEVLTIAAKGIAEVITKHFDVNIDLRDAKTVLSDSGTAIMGSARGKGEGRALQAVTGALDSPLLNDNKIVGAKNVLLLIVYGKDEITMDETEEINEYIQREAGGNYQTNIIMGVGEDETLDDEIAVTVIATGFNSEQQHEIIDLEQKKIVHTLGEEQLVIQDLDTKTTFTDITFENSVKQAQEFTQQKVIFNLDDTAQEQDDVPVGITTETIAKTSIINKKTIEEPIFVTKPAQPIVQKEVSQPKIDFVTRIKNNPLYNIPVDYEIITAKKEVEVQEEEFVIYSSVDTTSKTETQSKEQIQTKVVATSSTMIKEEPQVVTFDLFADIEEIKFPKSKEKKIEQTEPQPVITESGQIRHNLEEYMQMEEMLTQATVDSYKSQQVIQESPELQFQTRVVANYQPSTTLEETEINPNSSYLTELKAGADNRRKKFKSFNHTFSQSSNRLIRELDEIPAYKRQGVQINSLSENQGNVSRLSLNFDSNDTLQIRTNNSFLHDNVD
ncbi:cell division protein FtsZ [Capnocytophaga catalasegens]|uniref:Cell division protein FtsZ n=1 Tax=Capnocytophaga catalasegens TaxID=1004260 RepID=A0AAV5AUZ1_9FLAO|nr:cell division protein FtsZ [Capnocytophaga catalasegens]GIZ14829.1 cell division protein FtsZ [Capnocytophaga catalasegens]GJM49165.1 cell division protein FtsZ [Capnocytophaga catalasegens]GJM52622.1 cell division protein FtsZ [Capnocytophaga catalasegens]